LSINSECNPRRCDLCNEWFDPPGRTIQAPDRKGWFCRDSHRFQYVTKGRRLCLCCETAFRDKNQLVCNWCHVNVYGGRLQ